MAYEFLSDDWVKAVRAVRDEYADRTEAQAGGVELPALRVNLSITGAPAHLGDVGPDGTSVVHAHADTSCRPLSLEIGALPDADLTVTVDHDTAYALLVEQRPNAVLGAFLMGRIKVTGDVATLTEEHGLDLAALPQLLASLGVTGSSTLADLDPVAAEIGDRIRDLTL
jgi:hypothetical protein